MREALLEQGLLHLAIGKVAPYGVCCPLHEVKVTCTPIVITDSKASPENLVERIKPAAVGIATRVEIGSAFFDNGPDLFLYRSNVV
jgi:hypothetical protein